MLVGDYEAKIWDSCFSNLRSLRTTCVRYFIKFLVKGCHDVFDIGGRNLKVMMLFYGGFVYCSSDTGCDTQSSLQRCAVHGMYVESLELMVVRGKWSLQ